MSFHKQKILLKLSFYSHLTNHKFPIFSILYLLSYEPATAIVLGQIDTSDTFEVFGKFTWAVLDIAIDIPNDSPAPIEFVYAKKCYEEKTIQFTVNVRKAANMDWLIIQSVLS